MAMMNMDLCSGISKLPEYQNPSLAAGTGYLVNTTLSLNRRQTTKPAHILANRRLHMLIEIRGGENDGGMVLDGWIGRACF